MEHNEIITERQFREFEVEEARSLALWFAEVVNRHGVKLYAIAKATGIHWNTINKLRQGEMVSFRVWCRIKLYFKKMGYID